jgi:polyisoprenoid-binding protein YceI
MTAPVTEIPGYVAGTWDIDPAHSHIGFEARHMFVHKVRGHFEQFEARSSPPLIRCGPRPS